MEIVGFIASLLGIWEFARRILFKKRRFPAGRIKKLNAAALVKETLVQHSATYRPGQPIVIRDGPFAGLEATFERSLSTGRVVALLELLDSRTHVVLSKDMVAAL